MSLAVQQDTIYAHDRYTSFYELELTDFLEDLPFYRQHLPPPPARILELGCGTGRLGRALADGGYRLVGIDLSQAMLREAVARQPAGESPPPAYLCMDMTRLAFRTSFDAIIIPYNTMNLLTAPGAAEQCLAEAGSLLAPGGRLLLQLFVPARAHLALIGKKQFQFQIFDCPDGAKVIKEILKWREGDSALFNLRETYRLRYRPNRDNEDWQYDYQILGYDYERWRQMLSRAGFAGETAHGDYHQTPFTEGSHSTLLLAARRQ